MTIVLLGPTGAGKSTVASVLHTRLKYEVISTGEYVRRNFPTDPLDGGFSDREKQIKEYVDQWLKGPRVVLDGFPRHLDQLVWLRKRLKADKLLPILMRIGRSEAYGRVWLRGREYMSKFKEQFEAQNKALDLMEQYLVKQKVGFIVTGTTWSPDEIVDRIAFVCKKPRSVRNVK